MLDVEKVSRDLSLLTAETRALAVQLVQDARAAGLCVAIFEAWRSTDRQNWLKEQGKSTVGADSMAARHVRGMAVDVVFLNLTGQWTWNVPQTEWQKLGAIGMGLGLTWGGSWQTFKDYPHFQTEDS